MTEVCRGPVTGNKSFPWFFLQVNEAIVDTVPHILLATRHGSERLMGFSFIVLIVDEAHWLLLSFRRLNPTGALFCRGDCLQIFPPCWRYIRPYSYASLSLCRAQFVCQHGTCATDTQKTAHYCHSRADNHRHRHNSTNSSASTHVLHQNTGL